MPNHLERRTGRFLVAGHDDDDLRIGEHPGLVQRTQGVNHHDIASFHVADPGAVTDVPFAAKAAAGINRVEVTEQ